MTDLTHEAIADLPFKKPDGTIINLAEVFMNAGSSFSVIDEDHAEAHRGMSYTGGTYIQDILDGAANKRYYTGHFLNAGKQAHTIATISTGGDIILRFLTGFTGQSGGTSMPAYNRLTGLADSGFDAWADSSLVGGPGVSLKEFYIPGGKGPLAVGGSGGQRAERIISSDTWIAFEIENVSGITIDYLSVDFGFYLQDEIVLP
jgi:hypothetical protein